MRELHFSRVCLAQDLLYLPIWEWSKRRTENFQDIVSYCILFSCHKYFQLSIFYSESWCDKVRLWTYDWLFLRPNDILVLWAEFEGKASCEFLSFNNFAYFSVITTRKRAVTYIGIRNIKLIFQPVTISLQAIWCKFSFFFSGISNIQQSTSSESIQPNANALQQTPSEPEKPKTAKQIQKEMEKWAKKQASSNKKDQKGTSTYLILRS